MARKKTKAGPELDALGWPETGGLHHSEDVVRPLLDVLDTLYTLERTGRPGAKYEGPGFPEVSVSAVCPHPADQLSEEGLGRHGEQGRTAAEVILTIAFQLGICQGMRMERQHNKLALEMIERGLSLIKRG